VQTALQPPESGASLIYREVATLTFRAAQRGEENSVLQLYRSVIGTEFCVWDDGYPTCVEIDHDLSTGNLFALEHSETLAGAISIIPEHELDELDDLSFWTSQGPSFSFARVVIAPGMQGKGLACKLVRNVEKIIQGRGGKSIRILAAVGNLPAIKTYKKLGYRTAGECHLFGHAYFGMEKRLEHDTISF